jgi:hypothetical protein
MPAEIIDLKEYKEKLQSEELKRLSAQVDAILQELPAQDTVGWYTDQAYCTWIPSGLNMEYEYEQSKSCPSCGKSYDEE